MNPLTQHASFTLVPDRVLRLDRVRGARIRIAQGQVWLTETGQLDDNVLGYGDEYTVHSPGVVVVEALTGVHMIIERNAGVSVAAVRIAQSLFSVLAQWMRMRITHIHLGQAPRAFCADCAAK